MPLSNVSWRAYSTIGRGVGAGNGGSAVRGRWVSRRSNGCVELVGCSVRESDTEGTRWKKPTLLLGGGGYCSENAARCWSLLTATALGRFHNHSVQAKRIPAKVSYDEPTPLTEQMHTEKLNSMLSTSRRTHSTKSASTPPFQITNTGLPTPRNTPSMHQQAK